MFHSIPAPHPLHHPGSGNKTAAVGHSQLTQNNAIYIYIYFRHPRSRLDGEGKPSPSGCLVKLLDKQFNPPRPPYLSKEIDWFIIHSEDLPFRLIDTGPSTPTI